MQTHSGPLKKMHVRFGPDMLQGEEVDSTSAGFSTTKTDLDPNIVQHKGNNFKDQDTVSNSGNKYRPSTSASPAIYAGAALVGGADSPAASSGAACIEGLRAITSLP